MKMPRTEAFRVAIACYNNENLSPKVNDVFLLIDGVKNIQWFVDASKNYGSLDDYQASAKLFVLAKFAMERGYTATYSTQTDILGEVRYYLHVSPKEVLVFETMGSADPMDWTLVFRSRGAASEAV